MSSQSCQDWPRRGAGCCRADGRRSEARRSRPLGPAPAIQPFGVLEVVVEAVGDIQVIGEEEHALAVKPSARGSVGGVEDAAEQHRRLDAGREEARPGGRIAAQGEHVLDALRDGVEFESLGDTSSTVPGRRPTS